MIKTVKICKWNEANVGSCVVKCMELLYNFFGFDMKTYTILGISEFLDIRYRRADFKNKIIPLFNTNKSMEIEKFINERLPLNVKRSCFSSFEEGMDFIKDSILREEPILVGINSYHLPYCDDYHTKPGGLFEGYHMMIIKGFDDEKKEFYTIDPALYVEDGVIIFDDFEKAWSDDNGIKREYVPYTYYSISLKSEFKYKDLSRVIYDSAINSIKLFFDENKIIIFGDDFYRGQTALLNMIEDLKEVMKCDDKYFRNEVIQTISDGVFHSIRWARKSFGLFLRNDIFKNNPKYDEQCKKIDDLFENWSEVYMRAMIALKTGKIERVSLVIDSMLKIIDKEKGIFSYFMEELGGEVDGSKR